jgi:rfaE bifunctional protein nucleotidyltransferase chain/domain
VIVFTNGVFDILHAGHISYLQRAATHGRLIVGVNSDASATRIKRKPVNDQMSRCTVIGALYCVERAYLFDEDKPLKLLRMLKPDLYIKGGDYNIDELEEAALVKSWGGHAATMSYVPGYSTTDIIARIREGSLPR